MWDLETKMGVLGSACLLVGHPCTVGKPLRTAVSLHSLARSRPPHPGLLLDRTASVVRTRMPIPVLPFLIQRGGALSSLSLSVFTNSFSDHRKPGSLYPQMYSPIVQGVYFLHPPHGCHLVWLLCVCLPPPDSSGPAGDTCVGAPNSPPRPWEPFPLCQDGGSGEEGKHSF